MFQQFQVALSSCGLHARLIFWQNALTIHVHVAERVTSPVDGAPATQGSPKSQNRLRGMQEPTTEGTFEA